ncbi:MAG: dephospho-CoA kinase [Treponema sp.]|jgi:dephospho-CoA kinase|nr:dephospho-CoA kinase [Treponema sp.]
MLIEKPQKGLLIGLTGKYCAGKNYTASLLEKRGLSILDVDKLGYRALEAEKEAVFALFGSDIKHPDGSLDRRLLGKKVFGNPQKLAALEDIVHPAANRLTEEWIKEASGTELVINAALLHRSSVFNRLDKIIIVKAPFLTRLFRARRRDKLPWVSIFKRFASQKDFDSQYLAVNAEIYIVENSNNKLKHQIDAFLEGIK